MQQVIDVSGAMVFSMKDGTVTGTIEELDVAGSGVDEDEAKEALIEVLKAKLEIDEPFRETFNAWAQDHIVEVEMSESDIREEEEVESRAKEAGKDFMELSPESFEGAIASSRPLLVDFWAPWCKPCLFAAPVLKEIHDEMADAFNVAKVNVEEYPDLGNRFDVQGIPCFILFKDGQEVDRIIGSAPKAEFRAQIDQVLAKA